MACAEFSVQGKPVLTWTGEGSQGYATNHINALREKAILYHCGSATADTDRAASSHSTQPQPIALLLRTLNVAAEAAKRGFANTEKSWVGFTEFTTECIMRKFVAWCCSPVLSSERAQRYFNMVTDASKPS